MTTRIRAIVVDHDGGEMTVRSIQRLLAASPTSAELEVVLVDNASAHPALDEIGARWPAVDRRHSPVNLGFGGGCNLALRDVDNVDYVALVNNDLEVADGWLEPLLTELRADEKVAAACPKILFADRQVELMLECEPSRRGRGDRRMVGVRVSGAARPDKGDMRVQFVHGFHSPEPPLNGDVWFRWTKGDALLRIPAATGGRDDTCTLRLGADRPTDVTVRSGSRTTYLEIGPGDAWYSIAIGGEAIDVVNNVGSMRLADGYGADRGFLEPDDGRFDIPQDVTAWCGGAVLLRASYLADVGLFDERLFLYYEDLELSLRGARRDWRYRYVPSSVVRHAHSATAVEGSPLARHYNERNRLLVLLRHDGAAPTVKALFRYAAATLSYVRRDVFFRLLRGQRPRPDVSVARIRSAAGFVRRAPVMLRSRRADARRLHRWSAD